MAAGGLYALSPRYDYRQAGMVELVGKQLFHLFMVAWQGVDGFQPLGFHSEAYADFFEFACALRILSACHAGGEVVGDDYGHGSVFVDGIEQPCHAGMGEG